MTPLSYRLNPSLFLNSGQSDFCALLSYYFSSYETRHIHHVTFLIHCPEYKGFKSKKCVLCKSALKCIKFA